MYKHKIGDVVGWCVHSEIKKCQLGVITSREGSYYFIEWFDDMYGGQTFAYDDSSVQSFKEDLARYVNEQASSR